jgi:hypothetical protein
VKVAMTDQPPSHPDFDTVMSAPHWGELLSLYNVYRDYMKHEDDLINQRASWHLLLQGFLFATFGVMGEWQTEGGTGFLHPRRYWILYGLIATAFLSHCSLPPAFWPQMPRSTSFTRTGRSCQVISAFH